MTFDEVSIVGVVMHRHQFDGRHAEVLQMVDRLIRSESRVRASHGLGQPRMPSREPLDVEFVNDRLVPRRARTAIVTPREGGIDDRGQHRERRVVATVEGEVFFRDP